MYFGCNADDRNFLYAEYLNKVPYRKDIILKKKILHGKKNKK